MLSCRQVSPSCICTCFLSTYCVLGPVADLGAAVVAASRAWFLGDGCEWPGGPGLSTWREAGGCGRVCMQRCSPRGGDRQHGGGRGPVQPSAGVESGLGDAPAASGGEREFGGARG